MFCQISRGLRVTVLALLSQGLFLGCSAGDAGPTGAEHTGAERVGSVQQAQSAALRCDCLNLMGEPASNVCFDTCFKTTTCGDPSEQCNVVCKFQTMTTPGEPCSGAGPVGEYEGQCAVKGVTQTERSGCCPGCLTDDFECGGISKPTACGGKGETCSVCEDKDPNDCWYPTCEDGKCVGDLDEAPVGNTCTGPGTIRGRCADGGVCCMGCLTPGGSCLEGDAAGACGSGGVLCHDCDDGQACNGAEQCQSGTCVAGTELECDDNDPCTDDSCDDAVGCENEVDVDNDCSDGNGCTENDACQTDGSCAGTAMVCDDGNDCTDDSCQDGLCVFDPANDTDACDDGSSCTLVTSCDAGVCVSSSSSICHDTSNPCKTSSCGDDGLGACVEVNRDDDTPCDDGNPCTADDSCISGVCTGGGATDCDDNNDCTTDTCEMATGCAHANATGECADGNLCTINDSCQGGECVGDVVDCPASNECTSDSTCDVASGLCSLLLVEDGTECGNGGECETGQCVNEDEPVGSGGSAGNGGTGGSGVDGTTSTGGSGTTGDAGAAGETGDGGTSSTSSGTSAGTAGAGGNGVTGGGAGSVGAGGTDAGGSSNLGGNAGTAGAAGSPGSAGTYAGDDFQREAKGCDCRTAPGGTTPSHAGLGLLGLGAMLGGRLRRRNRAR